MRYAVITAAVFGSAMIMAPGSQALQTHVQNLPSFFEKPTIVQLTTVPHNQKQITAVKVVARQPNVEQVAEQKLITVEPDDSLTKIADDNQVTVQRLYDANPSIDDPNIIHSGQQLRLPSADEQIPSRPLPVAGPTQPVVGAVAHTQASDSTATQQTPVAAAVVASGSVWDQLAACESGGNWAIDTGNGFYGGLQFTLATWQGLGGSGLPSQASRDEQIARAETLQARSGWGQWPACSAKLGLM